MPEDTGGLSPDRLDDALDLVLDQDPADRLEFILSEFADEPDLADRLIALVQSGQAGGEMLAVADHAAQRLLDASDEVAQETAEEVALPESIGPYRVLDRLGSGGMGTVYLAERHDGEMDRKVALKVITGAAHRLEIQRRFIAERLILSRLEHPNVARLYDVGVDDLGAPFFVMEYVDGVPIDECADKSALSVDHRLALIRQVTDALSYAHANLVVHRDVKPSNILVTRDGVVKLLDFGVAKLLDDQSSGGAPLTRPGAAVLTPEYASPEQIRGEAVTTATDVYATGVLLYELLTGIRPYEFSSRSSSGSSASKTRRRRPRSRSTPQTRWRPIAVLARPACPACSRATSMRSSSLRFGKSLAPDTAPSRSWHQTSIDIGGENPSAREHRRGGIGPAALPAVTAPRSALLHWS